jgi:hypothetical protein
LAISALAFGLSSVNFLDKEQIVTANKN